MEHQRINRLDRELPVSMRITGVAMGCLLLIVATTILMRTAWDADRAALVSERAMILLLPVVLAGFFLCAVGVILLALGGWPRRGQGLMEVTAAASLALVVAIAWLAAERAEAGRDLGTTGFIIGTGVLAVFHIGIAAVVQRWWWLVAAPTITAALVFNVTAWELLASDTRRAGGELAMAGGLLGLIVWGVLVPTAVALAALGVVIGRSIAPRSTA
jgi:hypothetical protein